MISIHTCNKNIKNSCFINVYILIYINRYFNLKTSVLSHDSVLRSFMRYKCASELHYNEVFAITNSAKENKILIID